MKLIFDDLLKFSIFVKILIWRNELSMLLKNCICTKQSMKLDDSYGFKTAEAWHGCTIYILVLNYQLSDKMPSHSGL